VKLQTTHLEMSLNAKQTWASNGMEPLRLTRAATKKLHSRRMAQHLIFLLVLLLFYGIDVRIKASTPSPSGFAAASADDSSSVRRVQADSVRTMFETKIKPILTERCQPCHFTGGKMYAKLPFDDPKTVRALGVKLFTRIKDEKEQALFRAFFSATQFAASGTSPQR